MTSILDAWDELDHIPTDSPLHNRNWKERSITTPEQRTRLKAAAEAATPGPWKSYETVVQFNGELPGGFDVFHCPRAKETTTFIALANPAAILDLITRIESLEARVASAEGALRPFAEDDGMFNVNSDYVAARAHFQSQGGDHGRD